MIELKEWTASEIEEYDDARLELAEDGKIDCTRVYIKADADEVISTIRAERDEYRYNLSCARNEIHNLSTSMKEDVKTIAELKKQVHDYAQGLYVIQARAEKEARHQKWKRCLAMAERCKFRMYYLAAVVEQEASKIIPLKEQIRRYEKRERRMDYWKNRWLELADKFKDKEA